MLDKKLTDNEIVNPCYLCKHPNEKPNRRKHYKCNNEECEWLKCWARVKELEEKLKTTKAEAYKEFAERLNKIEKFRSCVESDNYELSVTMREVDNVLKELVGDSNAILCD